ncbi:MAG: ATP-binding protein [Burkholderiaceae bacterium]
MAVQIDSVRVRNFRSIADHDFILAAFTPLVGYNNSGKSNFLSVIQWLIRKHALSEVDFRNPQLPVEVEGTISGISADVVGLLTPAQQVQLTPFIVDGSIKIKRTQRDVNCRATDINLTIWDPRVGNWRPNPTGIDNAVGVILPEPIRIGAMVDAAEDATKSKTSTTIGKLLAEFLGPFKARHEEDLTARLVEVERCISSSGYMRFEELGVMDDQITSKIHDLFPGVGARLHFPVPHIDELFKAGTLRLCDENGTERDFSSYGHGTQRSVQMALIRHLAEIRQGERRNGVTTLLLIDEPELYLHPFAIEQVRVALKALSGMGYQVIFSTHSSQLIQSEDAQYTLLVRKRQEGTYTRRRLRDAIARVVPDAEHQAEHLFSLSNSSQILFADKVVLSEGKTEQRLIPAIYHAVRGATLGQERTALVAQGGVNNTTKSMAILTAMDLPCKAVVDLDYAFNGAVANGLIHAEDPDIATLKRVLQTLAQRGLVTLHDSGLPKNGSTGSASDGFKVLAEEPDAREPISRLHDQLVAQNIWLWTKGSIEAHLGITGKTEANWSGFQRRMQEEGLLRICIDYASVQSLVNWLAD